MSPSPHSSQGTAPLRSHQTWGVCRAHPAGAPGESCFLLPSPSCNVLVAPPSLPLLRSGSPEPGVAWCSSQQRPGTPPTPSPSPCPPAFLPEQRGALLNLDALKIAAPGLGNEKPEPVRGQLRPPLCPASAGLSQHGVQGSGPACWPVVRAWSRHRRTTAAGEQASHQALPQGFRGLHSDL